MSSQEFIDSKCREALEAAMKCSQHEWSVTHLAHSSSSCSRDEHILICDFSALVGYTDNLFGSQMVGIPQVSDFESKHLM